MNIAGKVLIVDDDTDVLTSARILLKRNNYDVTTESNPEKIPFLINEIMPDVILLDMNFKRDVNSGKEGLEWLNKIQIINDDIVVIMITGFGDVDIAVKSIKLGAIDFVQKPWQNEKLLATINSAFELNKTKKEIKVLKEEKKSLIQDNNNFNIIGESDAMKSVFNTIRKVASTDANVLILGENGTGKELVAKQIHRYSIRKNNSFITLDLGLIQENLFESELFGHKKGAFTGADNDRIGKMQLANNGTLFFDEVGNLPIHLQPKLLRALEGRVIQRLGDNDVKHIDIRLITATNSSIISDSNTGKFRKDLLYRLNTVEINLPPLRERGNDVILLADFYLSIYNNKYNKSLVISSAAYSELKEYNWPGNVRELRHTIEKSIILANGDFINSFDLIRDSKEKDTIPALNLEELEKLSIEKSLNKFNGNISKAAKALGITRASLYRRLEKHGL